MEIINSGAKEKALQFLLDHKNNLDFIDAPEIYENAAALEFADSLQNEHKDSADQNMKNLAQALEGFLKRKEKYEKFKNFSEEATKIYMETMDQRKMINLITKAIVSFPECVEKPFFYKNSEMINASYEIHKKLIGKGVGAAYHA